MLVAHANYVMTRSKAVSSLEACEPVDINQQPFHRLLYDVDLFRKHHTSYYLRPDTHKQIWLKILTTDKSIKIGNLFLNLKPSDNASDKFCNEMVKYFT